MKRNVNLEEISDGRLYGENDMVKAGCGDCVGCSACCQGMGDSIVLDPLDIFRLSACLGKSFDELLGLQLIELGVVDGIVLPHLKMAGAEEKCVFLNGEGRCDIHPYRPGICRLFPLGRYYENGSYRYFLQTKECRKQNRTKVKAEKWIDTPNPGQYRKFVTEWHYFLNDCEELLKQGDEDFARNLNLYLLRRFYQTPWDFAKDGASLEEGSFYVQFAERMRLVTEELGMEKSGK